MSKNFCTAVAYGLLVFLLSVVGTTIFGTHQIHLTAHPVAEDAAIYTALGLFLGMQFHSKNRASINVLHAVVSGFVVFWLIVFTQHLFGSHDIHLTLYPAAEDAAVYTALGLYWGLKSASPKR